MRTTYMAKPGDVKRKWYVVDAQGQTLGRLASEVAAILRGKTKPQYTPHIDVGDNVIIVNAEKIHLTGKKLSQKYYHRHSGYPGGLRSTRADDMRREKPEKMLEIAIKGMLPKNTLGREQGKKLFVYEGPEHNHQAQQPEELQLRG
ncbi:MULTISPECIES: 50S ribosomal protein L13 [Marinococcus]|uniref:50S ribosomal protein L13 n=1 Tax=Marinococcus TaxID=1370 RepID=UPI0003B6D1B8|nr:MULTISPECIES: 50S ribosomal protein L13 [Marinococcus]MDX6151415.1 50S ribosomal protein L13 [Marinococcus sp. PL1-022]